MEILVVMLVCDDEKEMDKAEGDNVSDELFEKMSSEFHMQYSGLEYEDEGGTMVTGRQEAARFARTTKTMT